MWDFITFRRMLTPVIIQFLFLLTVIFCIIGGFYNFFNNAFVHGLQILIIGPIVTRVVCEFLILFFRINETLTDLKNTVQERPEGVQSI